MAEDTDAPVVSDTPAEEAEINTEEEAEEVVVTIGEESPSSDSDEDSSVIRGLRKEHREQSKENRKLKKQLEELAAPKETDELGEKPVFKDYEYDEDKYQNDLEKYYAKEKEISKKATELEKERAKQTSDWQAVLDGHEEKKAKLKVKNFEEVESLVMDAMSVTQQGIIVQGADNSAKVVGALGTNPKKLQELSKIKDPVKFAFAVAKLETQLKVTTRKASTSPESKVTGDASVSGVVDSTLERLRAEAVKTGDSTKVVAYKKLKRKPS